MNRIPFQEIQPVSFTRSLLDTHPSPLEYSALVDVPNSGHTKRVKPIKFHPKALEFIRDQSAAIKQETW